MIDHIFNINKPVDWTSFDVVNKIRYTTRIKKVGHAGTLDPFATGVLLVLTGSNTKRQDEFMLLPKVYEAWVRLGVRMDTGDRTGTPLESRPVPSLTAVDIQAACAPFVGDIQQVPPMYSAKKIEGRKLYELARKGKTIHRDPVQVSIYDIQLMDQQAEAFLIRVSCGRGTYIRVLAEDIARSLGTEAYLDRLVRTAVGDYRIEDAMSIPEFIDNWKSFAA